MKGNREAWNIAQLEGTIRAFWKFLHQENFDRLIEIGTGLGVFTQKLAEAFSGSVFTFDIMRRPDRIEFPGITYMVADVFDNSIHEHIRELIELPGCVLLLCDGGNKPKEVNTFGMYLKPDDVIMAHDLGYEIQESDVHLDNMAPFYNDLFLPVCWLCLRRK